MSTDFIWLSGGNFSRWQKKKYLECQCQKQAILLPSQLFPFSSIVLTVLENDATKENMGENRIQAQ